MKTAEKIFNKFCTLINTNYSEYIIKDKVGFINAIETQFKSEAQPSEVKTADKPKIVTICGSGRFLKEMHEVEEQLTLEGKIVLMIGVNTKDVARTKDLEHYKPMLDELHLRKIDMSDLVFVVNVDGYIGESTRKEIEYAKSINKSIEYLANNPSK